MNTKLSFKKSIVAGLTAAGVSSVVNAILFFIFHGVGVINDSIFIQPDQPLTIVPIIISSVFPSIIGSIIFFFIEKYSTKGFKVFSIVSAVFVILTFANPFLGIPNVTLGYALALNLMHVVVAGFVLFFISRSLKNIA